MDTQTLIVLSAIVVGFLFLWWQQRRKTNVVDPTLLEWLKQTHQTIEQTSQGTRTELQHLNKALNDRLDNAARVIADVSKGLGQMSEIGRQMQEFQEFFKSPKLRGGVGEHILRDLLEQMLPKGTFFLQHTFHNGHIVDAAVQIEKGLVCIDAKFPLENFRALTTAKSEAEKEVAAKALARDVKKHIDDIAKKYILPQEGTLDFALMYIPSEPIYYEILNSPELTDYAHLKHVLPVSPNSFYYFLRLIIVGLEGRKMEEQAQQVLQLLRSLRSDSDRFGEDLALLTKHIKNAANASDTVNNRFARLSAKISTAHTLETPAATPLLDEPFNS